MVIEEIEYALMDCKTEADFLVINNLKLATHVANTLRWTGAEYEDLLQWARLALVRAAKGYRPEVGVKFSSYAYPAMQREVLRDLLKTPMRPKTRYTLSWFHLNNRFLITGMFLAIRFLKRGIVSKTA